MINRLNNGTHDNQAKVPTQTPQTHCKPNMIKFYKKTSLWISPRNRSHQNCTSFISVKIRTTCGINNQMQATPAPKIVGYAEGCLRTSYHPCH